MPDDAPWTDPVVVPDDLRELQPDIEAYHRELRLAARRRRINRITRSRWWQRFAFPLGLALGAISLAAVVFVVLTLGQPPRQAQVPPQPIATDVSAATGTVDGLIPDVPVTTSLSGDRTVSIRDERPALIALVPLHCGCGAVLSNLAAQAAGVLVPLVVVAPAATDAEVAALSGQLRGADVTAAFDATGSLLRTYGSGSAVTALVLNPDGVVSYAAPVTATSRIELPLERMAEPVISVSGH